VTTVGCIQSSYIPWRGYFDIIRRSDIFVFHDDIQYTKQDWRNRNRIKTAAGLIWLTIPVRKATTHGVIDEVEIDNGQDWGRKHWRTIETSYRNAPFFSQHAGFFKDALTRRWNRLSELNVHVISNICETLGIRTPLIDSRSLGLSGRKTDRLIQICRASNATRYLSGPSARDYIEPDKFAAVGVEIEYMAYDYPPYPQQFGPFTEGASIIDLLFNCGPTSIEFIVGQGAKTVPETASSNRDKF
jgi:hypothetical protein